ncbi:MAG: alanine--glyoxylate aminotransferase family protein [Candidatus Omnitrophota bacterium]
MRKIRLMAPGPTPVPEKVLLRMADTIIHHRTPQFQAVMKDVNIKLKKVFMTENPVITMSSSGTGAMETSVVNFLSAGDKAIVINSGKFGERFRDICKAYGIDCVTYDVESGKAADPAVVADLIKKNPDVKAVYGTLCETSTGVVSDIKAIGSLVAGTGAIFIVDAVSGLSADEFLPDKWGVDAVVSGSQKGLMLPPGLGFISISQKARKLMETSTLPKYYFSLKAALKSYEKDDTAWTPAVSLIMGLDLVLDLLLDEGMDNVLARHAKLAYVTREAVKAVGLELFAEKPSNAVTSVKVPQGVDGKALVKTMRDKEGITIAGGQSELAGKIFRIAHLGYMDQYDTIATIAAVEMVLAQQGYGIVPGKGVAKAQELLK